jgi:ESS family glutamate:Na+ symporter
MSKQQRFHQTTRSQPPDIDIMELALDNRQTLIVAILVYFLGKHLVSRIRFLREYNISQPVAGGVLASLGTGALYSLFATEVNFDLALRDMLLITFFATVGLSSRVETLIKGGRRLLVLLIVAVTYLAIQNITGIAVAVTSGLDPNVGIVGGSMSLSGGHGTAIAWAPVFEQDYAVSGAAEIGVACATFGLVLGGVIGGPIARALITRHGLRPTSEETLSVGLPHETTAGEVSIDVDSMLRTILVIAWSIGIGLAINEALIAAGVNLPAFVTALFAGILLTNTLPHLFRKLQWPTGTPALALVSDLSLGLFLAMSLMSLKLWTLAELAGPILAMLVAQVLVIVLIRPVHSIPAHGPQLRRSGDRRRLCRPGTWRDTHRDCQHGGDYAEVRSIANGIHRRAPGGRLLHRHRQLSCHPPVPQPGQLMPRLVREMTRMKFLPATV